jgi:two-component system nitrate/nitrite response regulator NarL
MKRHVFLTARAQPIPRWLEAFPDALILCGQVPFLIDVAVLKEASVIWLHIAIEGDSGATWVEEIVASIGSTPVVVLSNVPDHAQGMAVLASGASGYCSALSLPAVLRQVAGVVEHGGLWVGPQLMRRFMQGLAARRNGNIEPTLELLTPRERQVAEAASSGSTNKEIARTMGITERTVKAHLSAAFEKLGVRDRMQLSLLINGVEASTHTAQNIAA